MKSTRLFLTLFATTLLFLTVAAHAAGVDMKNPRRAVGREDDVRIDAQLLQDTVSPGLPIAVRWQVQNFSNAPIAVTAGVTNASYDDESGTIVIVIGSEIPSAGVPALTIIEPGATKSFAAAVNPALPLTARVRRGSGPRAVQVRVAILRHLDRFEALLREPASSRSQARLMDGLFERWLDSSGTIHLNSIPVRFQAARHAGPDASYRHAPRPGRF